MLERCEQLGIESVAFPTLGTGILKTPVKKSALGMSKGFAQALFSSQLGEFKNLK